MSEELTADEVAAFCAKLDRWGENLPPRERALLEALLKTASEMGSALSDADLESVAGGAFSIAQPTPGLTRPSRLDFTYEENGATHTDLASGNE
jgi:hypothetical protein